MINFPSSSIEWLKKLVSFDTTSRHSNLDLIETIHNFLAHHKIESQVTKNATGEKANLFATLPAQYDSPHDGLILSGHTDVVPVDGQQWNTNPFEAIQLGERIYGRGTCDMKGFIAVVLALVPEFCAAQLKKPLHLAFSYDEEIGCLGAPHLITDFLKTGIRPQACIVGEPTDMKLVTGHKGIHLIRCRVKGFATHSSLVTEGCNAIEYGAELITWIRKLGIEIRGQTQDNHYDVPFTSISTNLINGGNAVNTIPAQCEFMFELRNLPHIQIESILTKIKNYIHLELLPKMHKEMAEASIDLEIIASVPGFESDNKHHFSKWLHALTQQQEIKKVAYATEAGLFQAAGIATLVCGPGNIEQAHKPNEFVLISQLQKCEKFLRDCLEMICLV